MEPGALKRLSHYLYVADLLRGRRVLEIGPGSGDAAAHFGAASVVSRAASDPALGELADGSFDVVVVDLVAGADEALLGQARRLLAGGGQLVALLGPRPLEAREAAARLQAHFGSVVLASVRPFVGVALVEAGGGEVRELDLDRSLMHLGAPDEPHAHLVVAGGARPAHRALVVGLPPAEGLAALTQTDGGNGRTRLLLEVVARDDELARLTTEKQELEWRVREVEGRLAARDHEMVILQLQLAPLELLSTTAAKHEEEMRARLAELAERDAYVEEMRHELADAASAQRVAEHGARAASARADGLEAELRELRIRLSRAEGELLRRPGEPPPADEAARARVAELEALAAERGTAAEKASVRWREAEAKTDELWRKIGEMQKELASQREQAVENARAQRQAAQIALTRAVDEASKKLVSVQDMLGRTRREAKDLEDQRNALRERVAALEAERGTLRAGLQSAEATLQKVDGELRDEEARLEELARGLGDALREA